ncbi:MAG: hypothetical protein U7M05_12775 [Candidatus Igneacidithiobacillus chanchocoensis]
MEVWQPFLAVAQALLLPLVLLLTAWLLAVALGIGTSTWWRILWLVPLVVLASRFLFWQLEAYAAMGEKGLLVWQRQSVTEGGGGTGVFEFPRPRGAG